MTYPIVFGGELIHALKRKRNLGAAGLVCLCLLLFVRLLYLAPLAGQSAREALVYAGTALVPALFPAGVLGRFLALTLPTGRKNGLLARTAGFFGFSSPAFPAVLAGLVGGFPMGAYCAYALHREGRIPAEEAARIAALANNAGLAFLLGAVGAMLGSPAFGARIFLAQTAASLLLAALTSHRKRKKGNHSVGHKAAEETDPPPRNHQPSLALLSDCITQSAAAMVTVTGFVLFFAVVTDLTFSLPLFSGHELPLLLFLEPTAACRAVAGAFLSPRVSLCLMGFALGFSGLSVLMQSVALSRGALPLGRTLLTRLLLALLTVFFLWLFP